MGTEPRIITNPTDGAEHPRGELAGGPADQLVPLGQDAEVVERVVLSHGILPMPSGPMGRPLDLPDWLLR